MLAAPALAASWATQPTSGQKRQRLESRAQPQPEGVGISLRSSAVSPKKPWAVGESSSRSRAVFRFLILHWNGTLWR
jgi:hypothetical protein